uniref:Uncharacterized protein n=1 Tax=Trichuris muris TaxID=70415 RepID=A0A5S6R0Y5_TRIMR
MAPRSYMPANFYKPAVTPSYGVVGLSPRYSDRYPHVRYSGYAEETPGLSIINYSSNLRRGHYTQNYKPFRDYMDHTLSLYHTNLKLTPSYGYSLPRYGNPVRPYVHHMGIDDAVDLYKKRCLTSSALVKYWLTPTKLELRRKRELKELEPLYRPMYESPRLRRDFSSRLVL